MRIGVLVSGRGSNLQALLSAFPIGDPLVEVVLVATNRPQCRGVEVAKEAGVRTAAFPRSDFSSRAEQHAAIAFQLHNARAELIVLAGYDQILTHEVLNAFPGRVINVHPSLLPAFSGTLHAQRDALSYGVKVSGCTVHFVEQEVDSGPIIAQAVVQVLDNDTEDSLARRILEQEHQLLPQVIQWIAEGTVRVAGRRVVIEKFGAEDEERAHSLDE